MTTYLAANGGARRIRGKSVMAGNRRWAGMGSRPIGKRKTRSSLLAMTLNSGRQTPAHFMAQEKMVARKALERSFGPHEKHIHNDVRIIMPSVTGGKPDGHYRWVTDDLNRRHRTIRHMDREHMNIMQLPVQKRAALTQPSEVLGSFGQDPVTPVWQSASRKRRLMIQTRHHGGVKPLDKLPNLIAPNGHIHNREVEFMASHHTASRARPRRHVIITRNPTLPSVHHNPLVLGPGIAGANRVPIILPGSARRGPGLPLEARRDVNVPLTQQQIVDFQQ